MVYFICIALSDIHRFRLNDHTSCRPETSRHPPPPNHLSNPNTNPSHELLSCAPRPFLCHNLSRIFARQFPLHQSTLHPSAVNLLRLFPIPQHPSVETNPPVEIIPPFAIDTLRDTSRLPISACPSVAELEAISGRVCKSSIPENDSIVSFGTPPDSPFHAWNLISRKTPFRVPNGPFFYDKLSTAPISVRRVPHRLSPWLHFIAPAGGLRTWNPARTSFGSDTCQSIDLASIFPQPMQTIYNALPNHPLLSRHLPPAQMSLCILGVLCHTALQESGFPGPLPY